MLKRESEEQAAQRLVGVMWSALDGDGRTVYARKAAEHDVLYRKPGNKRATSAYNMFVREKFKEIRATGAASTDLRHSGASPSTMQPDPVASMRAGLGTHDADQNDGFHDDHSACQDLLSQCHQCGNDKARGIPKRKHWLHVANRTGGEMTIAKLGSRKTKLSAKDLRPLKPTFAELEHVRTNMPLHGLLSCALQWPLYTAHTCLSPLFKRLDISGTLASV